MSEIIACTVRFLKQNFWFFWTGLSQSIFPVGKLENVTHSELLGERGCVWELDCPESLHGREESESAEVLSGSARHVERGTKAPMTHLVNTRPL